MILTRKKFIEELRAAVVEDVYWHASERAEVLLNHDGAQRAEIERLKAELTLVWNDLASEMGVKPFTAEEKAELAAEQGVTPMTEEKMAGMLGSMPDMPEIERPRWDWPEGFEPIVFVKFQSGACAIECAPAGPCNEYSYIQPSKGVLVGWFIHRDRPRQRWLIGPDGIREIGEDGNA